MKTNITKDLFCDLCSLQFDKKYVYDVNMSLVHKKTKHSTNSSQSKVDEIAVKNENTDLGKKVAFESKKENMPHVCLICDSSCKTKSNLKYHIDAVHKGKKPHTCPICDCSYTTKSNLKEHINAVHERKKPHKCSICDCSYTTKSNLKFHIDAIHGGKKPHKCSICDRSFAGKDKLKRHVNSVHQDKIQTTTNTTTNHKFT